MEPSLPSYHEESGMTRLLVIAGMVLFLASISPVGIEAITNGCDDQLVNNITQSGLDFSATAEIFGCRQLASGEWTVANVGDDRSFARKIPSDLSDAVISGQKLVLADLRTMFSDPRLTGVFIYNIDDSTLTWRGGGNTIQERTLDGEPIIWPDFLYDESAYWGAIRNTYEQGATAYLLDPKNQSLATYFYWYVNRRDAAILSITTSVALGLAPPFATAFQNQYGYNRIPWPWEMTDPYTIDSYLIWLAEMTGVGS
jgi:hypothetical protein